MPVLLLASYSQTIPQLDDGQEDSSHFAVGRLSLRQLWQAVTFVRVFGKVTASGVNNPLEDTARQIEILVGHIGWTLGTSLRVNAF